MNPAPEIHWIHVVPKSHRAETVTLLVTLALLFALLFLMIGHPHPPPHPHLVVPVHPAEPR